MADSKRKKFIVPRNRLRQMQQDLRERKGAYDKNNTDPTRKTPNRRHPSSPFFVKGTTVPTGPDRTTQRANFIRMETEGRVGKATYNKKPKNIDPNFIMKREPKIMDPNFEMKREPKNIDPNFIMKDKGFDFPMSREGSPTVTDTETGETTYGRPKDFNKGGMMECRGGGIAITGKKFQGVF